MCTVLGNAVFHIYEHFRLTSATPSALKEGETYSASFRDINATVLPCYFFIYFLPPSPYIPAGVLVLLVCERLGSLLDERISLCTFRSPLQGLVPLQTNEETRGFAPNLSVRNSGPSSSWRRLNNCSLSVSRAFIISRSWDTFRLLPMMLFSLPAQHCCCFEYSAVSRSNTYVSLCWRLIVMWMSLALRPRWAAENRCVVTAVTVTDSEAERTVQSLTEIGADCSASGGGFYTKLLYIWDMHPIISPIIKISFTFLF